MESLPREITPNPLLSSTVELRFQEEFTDEFINDVLPKTLQDNFGMQKEEKENKDENSDLYSIIFKNEMFLVAIDKKSIIFENTEEYQLWSKYFPFIKAVIKDLNSDFDFLLERVGIRYVSFFKAVDNIMVLKKPFLMIEDEIGEVSKPNFYGNYTFYRGTFRYAIQVGNRVQFPGETKSREGCVIDLDISDSEILYGLKDDSLFTLIDSLHTEEKRLFISLLNKQFLNSLNIQY